MTQAPLPVSRRALLRLAAGGALSGLALRGARAQQSSYPTRAVRIIVPFTPGGTTDVVTRLVAAELGRQLGQSFIVENKPGAGTVVGVEAAAKSAPDGYTLITVANSFCANTSLVKKLPYDPADLRPVALMGMSEHVLAANPKSGLRNLADLVAAARKAPGSLSYASFGNGTSAHLAGEMLKMQAGIDLLHVPYKGQAPALNDLLGGQVTVMFGNWPEFRGHVDAGRLVALGMATAERSVYAPQVPTLAEQGVPLESNSWQGVLAPARVPEAIVAQLNGAINASLQAPKVQATMRDGGIASMAGSVDRFDAFLKSETARYAEVVRRAGITVDV